MSILFMQSIIPSHQRWHINISPSSSSRRCVMIRSLAFVSHANCILDLATQGKTYRLGVPFIIRFSIHALFIQIKIQSILVTMHIKSHFFKCIMVLLFGTFPELVTISTVITSTTTNGKIWCCMRRCWVLRILPPIYHFKMLNKFLGTTVLATTILLHRLFDLRAIIIHLCCGIVNKQVNFVVDRIVWCNIIIKCFV